MSSDSGFSEESCSSEFEITFSDGEEEEDFNNNNYWQEVDRMSEQYRQLTQQETRYIFEHEFNLNTNNPIYKIVTGFSAARGFVPAVRLQALAFNIDKTNHISFPVPEWIEFISYLKQLISYLKHLDEEKEDFCTENQANSSSLCFEIDYIKISSGKFLDLNMIKVDNGAHVYYLSELVVQEILSIDEKLVYSHLLMLYKLDFDTFYNVNFLDSAVDILSKSNYDLNPEEVLLSLCSDIVMFNLDLFNFMQLYCIRECLFYNRDQVLNHLDRKMYFVTKP